MQRIFPPTESTRSADIHIRINCEGRDLKLFWISLLPKKWISVGSADRNFIVSRRDTEGNLIGPEHAVRNPHITLHHEHFHLKANGTRPVFEMLTWAKPLPGELSSRWLRIITEPLQTLTVEKNARQSKRMPEVWRLEGGNPKLSAILCVDFAALVFDQNPMEAMQAKYIKWGNVLLKIQVGQTEARAASIECTTYG